MISYYGVPVNWPDGFPFGTLCILDKVEKNASAEEQKLIKQFGHVLELTLELVASNYELNTRNGELLQAMATIKTISGVVPLCAWCHQSIRDGAGEWVTLETYFESHTDAHLSHGMCPGCKVEFMRKSRKPQSWLG